VTLCLLLPLPFDTLPPISQSVKFRHFGKENRGKQPETKRQDSRKRQRFSVEGLVQSSFFRRKWLFKDKFHSCMTRDSA
jgi:hypothetical protein